MVNWGFEGGSPNSLIRHGVTKDTIPVGTVLIVQGYQSKAFDHKGVGVNMTLADGRKFLFGGFSAWGRVCGGAADQGRSKAYGRSEEVSKSAAVFGAILSRLRGAWRCLPECL